MLYIVKDKEEKSDELTTPWMHIELTPDEAEGELVEFEYPGTMGKDIYIIESVDADAKETLVRKLSDGTEYVIGDDFIPLNWNNFSTPEIGSQHTFRWKEHLNGAGDWVRTTRKMKHGNPDVYYGLYAGHENTRLVEKTFTYTPPGVSKVLLYNTYLEGLTVDASFDDYKLEFLEDMVTDISDTAAQVGCIYLNNNEDIVWYDIKEMYKSSEYEDPESVIDFTEVSIR